MAQVQALSQKNLSSSDQTSPANSEHSWSRATTATTPEHFDSEARQHPPISTAKQLEACSEAVVSDYFPSGPHAWHNARAYCTHDYEFLDVNDHAACLPHSTTLKDLMANLEVQAEFCEGFVMTWHNFTAFVDEELGLAVVTFMFRGHNTIMDQATIRETADRLMWRKVGDKSWVCYMHRHGDRSGALFP